MDNTDILQRLTDAIADGASITLTGPVDFPHSDVRCAVAAELTGESYVLVDRVVFRGAADTVADALGIVLRQWEAVK